MNPNAHIYCHEELHAGGSRNMFVNITSTFMEYRGKPEPISEHHKELASHSTETQ